MGRGLYETEILLISEEIPRRLRNQKANYRDHKNPQMNGSCSETIMYPVRTPTPCFFKVCSNIVLQKTFQRYHHPYIL